MQYRKLGRSDLTVSVVAMGCWAIGGGNNWGDQDANEIKPTVDAALDAGITLFDTAPAYGESERLLGAALAGRTDDALIATKISPADLHPDKVAAACDASLTAMGIDTIDLYQIHWPNHDLPIADTMGALQRLVDQGKVRVIGVCNFGPRDLTDALDAVRIESNQVAYSAIFRAIEHTIVPACQASDLGILCYSPLMHGLMTGKFKTPADFPDGRARSLHFGPHRAQVRHGEQGCEALTFNTLATIADISQRIGASMTDVALAWCLHQPGITSVLAGARRPDQITENAKAADLTLPPDILAELDAATTNLKQTLGPNADPWQGASNSRIQ